ncbi:excinuclease ABC subunit UvrC [Occallatibacter riparius]|uniref:UvrABC system protein C n=1 Tax=Occallatibacter riparius TaxID=1002689 RepID=A0A9J7BLZ2_9BACT|nr:excinuclease ABC subunit UvrC [Occallatibacter riparius]UWZ83505.1 excinuclease ABC subunit UvrC [Occallatibacter riparius]
MDLIEKIRTLPTQPGVYLYKNAEGEVIYVGKAKNLRSRVRSYLLEASQANAKTGSLMREAIDLDYILVANEHEALALENNLIKQKKPRFNILLRDDKTYPYVKLTLGDKYPKVFVTRRLRKDGSAYYGPYFPGNLAYRVAELIHRSFLIPSCKVDLNRTHPRACLEYYIHRCLGPCVEGLTTPEAYKEAVRDAQLFLEGKQAELERALTQRMMAAAENEQFEAAARLRDQLTTVHQLQEKQRIATAEQDDDADVFGYHFEGGSLAVNLFHMRNGKIVDRREFFWEDLPELMESLALERATGTEDDTSELAGPGSVGPGFSPDAQPSSQKPGALAPEVEFNPGAVFSALLKQLYIDQPYVPRTILVPVDFPDREALATLLGERVKRRIELAVPQRGEKRSLVDLAGQNAKQSYTQRFRVLEPSRKAIQEALADALMLPELPKRIECFDISHIQGAETVASLVVWEDGKMNKSAYRKFKVMTVLGVDDFASMREVVARRYKRILESSSQGAGAPGPSPSGTGDGSPSTNKEPKTMPSLILIDGGLGQLHAAADALEELGITNQPLASIAKKEEVIYVHGNEDEPVVLDRRSPVLHLVQMIRDESHRFAIGYHRQRRAMRDRSSELLDIPGVGALTRQRLIAHFGSLREVQQATAESLAAVVPKKTAESIWRHFHEAQPAS